MKRQVRFLRCACPFCLFSHAKPTEHLIEQLFLHLVARDFRQRHLRLLQVHARQVHRIAAQRFLRLMQRGNRPARGCDVARLGRDSLTASTWNSVWAALLFILGWLVTLPMWLIPGLGLVLQLFWMAWLNRRTFAYDALSIHASTNEWRELRRDHAGALLMLGVLMALLTHVPVLGLFAPSLAALAYIHYCLEALRRLRQGAVVAVQPLREPS